MEQSRVEEGLVFTWADLRSHEFGVGGEYPCALLVQVHPGHGGHVVDVVIVPETWEIGKLYATGRQLNDLFCRRGQHLNDTNAFHTCTSCGYGYRFRSLDGIWLCEKTQNRHTREARGSFFVNICTTSGWTKIKVTKVSESQTLIRAPGSCRGEKKAQLGSWL